MKLPISPILCVVPDQRLAIYQQFAKRCSTFSFCWPHSLHLLHSANPLEFFHDFVSTIFSSKVNTKAVFLGVRFCLSHKLYLSFCFQNISPCICFSRYSSFRFSSKLFFNLAFIAFHVGFQSFSIFSSPSKMQVFSESIIVPTACIDVIALSLIELVFISNSLFHAAFSPFITRFYHRAYYT